MANIMAGTLHRSQSLSSNTLIEHLQTIEGMFNATGRPSLTVVRVHCWPVEYNQIATITNHQQVTHLPDSLCTSIDINKNLNSFLR